METAIISLITAVSSFIAVWIVQNTKLKDGITDIFLHLVGKFGSKKIDLKTHKAFIIVKNYDNHLNLFLFNGHTKSIFYKEFIGIIFKNITSMIDEIIALYNDKKFIDNAEFLILERLENCRTNITKELTEKLVIPDKIQNQIDHWKNLMLNSLRSSVEQLITDDTNNETYFKIYRILDAILTTANFITGTGSILFNNINGAFDEIEVHQIYRSKESEDA